MLLINLLSRFHPYGQVILFGRNGTGVSRVVSAVGIIGDVEVEGEFAVGYIVGFKI